jgi:hypothetical protein
MTTSRSSKSDQRRTYSTSSSIRSAQVIWFRPFTCAQPVIAGRMSSRCLCPGVYLSTW